MRIPDQGAAQGGDTVRVHLVRAREPGPAEVTVLLDRRVRWQVRMSGGVSTLTLERL